MEKLIINMIRFVLDLFEGASEGDEDALNRLKNFLPEQLQTELIAQLQDKKDLEKFGER